LLAIKILDISYRDHPVILCWLKKFITVALIIFYTVAAAFATSVSFNQSTYSVNEDDGPIQLVLALSSPTMTSITVEIEYSDDTATGMLFLILQIILYSIIS